MEYEAVSPDMATVSVDMSTGTQSWYSMLRGHLSHVDPWAFDLLVCGIVSFVLGFVCKNFGKMLVLAGALAFLGGYLMESMGYYAIPWHHVQGWLGFGQVDTWAQGIEAIVQWVKDHPAGTGAAVLGFALGWKVG